MRRNSRLRKNDKAFDKVIMYSGIGVAVLAVIVFALLMYSKSLNNQVQESKLSADKIASIVDNSTNTESASTSIGKSVEEQEESKNELDLANTVNEANTTNSVANALNSSNNSNKNLASNTNNSSGNANSNTSNSTTKQTNSETTNTEKETISKKELNFEKPVEGEITKEFAKENLIYSQTLQEWVTHTGIDIKAEKTTVVKAAEEGTVKSIKNDPRYGLTIVIEHQEGFQTIYSNLLTSEFVTEGEKVTKGQTIGTVGNTAVFEVADEPHLHFEILKDSTAVDPSIYLK